MRTEKSPREYVSILLRFHCPKNTEGRETIFFMPFRSEPRFAASLNSFQDLDERASAPAFWLVIWCSGFVGTATVAAVACGALWLVGHFAKEVSLADPVIVHFSTSAAVRYILPIAAGLGIYMATLLTLKMRHDRRIKQEGAVRIPGHHPVLGDFAYAPFHNAWHAEVILPDGEAVPLWGDGSLPSDAQVTLWSRFLAKRDRLLGLAADALLAQRHPHEGCSAKFTPSSFHLRGDGRMEAIFNVHAELGFSTHDHHREAEPTVILSRELTLDEALW